MKVSESSFDRASGSKGALQEPKLQHLLKDVNRRFETIEKESSSINKTDIEEMRRRLRRIEQLHEEQKRKAHSFLDVIVQEGVEGKVTSSDGSNHLNTQTGSSPNHITSPK